MSRLKIMLTTLLAVSLLGGALAQGWPPLSDSAQERIRAAEMTMAQALATYPIQYPDRPLWEETFAIAEEAVSLAPMHPEPYRLQAIAHSRANWFGPAWDLWQEYLARGFPLDSAATPFYVDTGHRMAYSYYELGLLELSLATYLAVLDQVPYDLEANRWVGRILLELERPSQAISYWSTVVERNPSDNGAKYFLDLARDQVAWGTGAANAFYEGVAYYEAGSMAQARDQFSRATLLNPAYAEAHAWLGRIAFELGNYVDARSHYGRALDIQPTNETYRYFHEESGRRQ